MSEDSARRRLFGALLMALGGLIALLCGLCSLSSFVGMTWGMISSLTAGYGAGALSGLLFSLVIVGVVGGLPTFVGVLMFRRGLRMRRGAQARIPVGVFGDAPDDPA